ncbi:hypothetical protein CG50_00600 [Paenirhodobacter enshiensis]|uniref:Adenylate cyclase n=2 Tax=Paenirhodobacter enshiensis TaxID=1105367 RepID=A0A086XXQ0_9RHOB|nr:hypothetical protein CG50_00600 [Paenirhodobacter enshiensis]
MPPPSAPLSGRRAMDWLRSASGTVILCFVTMHLLNHAMLLVSIDRAEALRPLFTGPWQTLPGEVLLYGSLIFHAGHALFTLYARRTLTMPPWEMVQLIFGLLIPYLLADHIVSAGIGRMAYGWETTYRGVLHSMWVDAPPLGLQQAVAVIVVWTHGCIGAAKALRHRFGTRGWMLPALVVAGVLPTLALAGFVVVGRGLAIYGFLFNTVSSATPMVLRSTHHEQVVSTLSAYLRNGYVLVLVGVLMARQLRSVLQHARGFEIRYDTGALVHALAGTSVLEASRMNGIAQYSVCGGSGRCSTCRVRVLESDTMLPPPNEIEAATLRRIGADGDIRLACQLRPRGNLQIERVLVPATGGLQPTAEDTPPVERQRVVLFCDIRGFTTYSERHLPYDVVFLLNRYFEAVGSAVEAEGGRIDKFIGDGAMAIFATDDNLEAGCSGAIRAAIAIRRAVDELSRDIAQNGEAPLTAVAGIHAGPVIVGRMGIPGATAVTVVGDTVNVASRLETVAKQENMPIVVSAEVADRSGLDFGGIVNHEIAIRGRSSMLRVYLIDEAATQRLAPEPAATL